MYRKRVIIVGSDRRSDRYSKRKLSTVEEIPSSSFFPQTPDVPCPSTNGGKYLI